MHWADQSTRELLTFLLTRPTTRPFALVVSYRSDDLNRRHPLRAVLAEWHRLSAVTRLHLERLDETDIRSMIANLQPVPLPEREVQRIVARAEGNPFFAEELVSAADNDCGSLPTELADLLLVRLDRLGDHGRLAVRAAAVAGRQVSHNLLAHASGLSDGDLDLALRSAVEANVLLPTAGDRYMFRHALLAEAVYDDLLPGERVRLHAAYARALKAHDVPGTAAELARHARAAHDLVTAARASVRAGEEAMAVGGPDEAARHYELALELLADPDVAAGVDEAADEGEPIDRVDLATKACDAAVSAGHVFRALALAQDQLRALAPDAGAVDRARMLLTVASTARLVDTRVDVLALTTEAVGLLPADASDELRAQLLNIHALANADRARDDDAGRWAGEAQVLARSIGRLDIAVEAATTLARITERAGDPEKSKVALVAAVEEARVSGEVSAELRSLFNLAGLHYELGKIPRALEIYQQTRQRALQAGLPWGPYGLEARWMTATAAYVVGDWDLAARTTDITGESPPDLAEALLRATGMEVAAGRGSFDALERVAGASLLVASRRAGRHHQRRRGHRPVRLPGRPRLGGGDPRRRPHQRVQRVAGAGVGGPDPAGRAAARPSRDGGRPRDDRRAGRPGGPRRRPAGRDRGGRRAAVPPYPQDGPRGSGLAGSRSRRARSAALAVGGRPGHRGPAGRRLARGGVRVRGLRPRLRDRPVTSAAGGRAAGDRSVQRGFGGGVAGPRGREPARCRAAAQPSSGCWVAAAPRPGRHRRPRGTRR